MAAGFELFDHTADAGIHAFGPTLEALPPAATAGLYAVIGELAPGGEGRPERIEVKGNDPAVMLRDFLARLLLLFEAEGRIIPRPRVISFRGDGLMVEGESFAIDEKRSVLLREVKAVTYHDLNVEQTSKGWEAKVIVDI